MGSGKMGLKNNTSVLCFCILLILGSVAFGKTIYVDAGATGANNGSSWANAYNYLQDALTDATSAAKPVEIRVAQGFYKPDRKTGLTPGNRAATFQLISSVTLMGGFGGIDATDPNVRDFAKYGTILSGDLNGDDAPGFVNHGDNSYHVVTASGTDATAVLDGFIIAAGYANGTSQNSLGGGLYIFSGSPAITNCTFVANTAASADGGAIYNAGSPMLTGCVFADNKSGGSGGGLRSTAGRTTLLNCLFNGNLATRYGGGLSTTASIATLTNCTFAGNYAMNGKALACDSVPRSGAPSTLTWVNCILWDGGNEIWKNDSSAIAVDYSDVQAGWTTGTGNINIDPCFAEHGHWSAQIDPNMIVEPNDPNASWIAGDYHLKSQAGRWEPSSADWVLDQVTSLCIDTGRTTDPVGLEPFPNGGIINMGTYGGTVQASKSYFGGPLCETVIAGDLNGDCKVDFSDFRLLGLHWLGDYREKLHVQWLGHAAVKIWTSTVVIYVDPYNLTTSPKDATLLLITHSHNDHYSTADIARVSGPTTQLIGPSSVITAAGKGTLILPGQTIDLGSVRITGVIAYNSNHPKSNNWLGFIVEILGKRIFCAGDTSLTTELKAVQNMDVAFLPIDGVYNMSATTAAEATQYMLPKLAVPYHWGTSVGTLADAQTFAKLAACPVKIMTVGEEIVF